MKEQGYHRSRGDTHWKKCTVDGPGIRVQAEEHEGHGRRDDMEGRKKERELYPREEKSTLRVCNCLWAGEEERPFPLPPSLYHLNGVMTKSSLVRFFLTL